jgi:hypothetical protein
MFLKNKTKNKTKNKIKTKFFKYLFCIMFIILIFVSFLNIVSAISLIDAKNISKDYFLDNEFIDNNTKIIYCNNETYFVVPALNSNGDVSFFVPINNNSSEVYIEDDETLNSIFKTTYFLRVITKSSSSNYLSLQLVDKINQLILVLNSKKSQIQGVINNNYSLEINNSCEQSKLKLNNLLDNLISLKEKLDNAYRMQEDFINNTNCSKTNDLIITFKDSFNGYLEITELALNFQDSANQIIEQVVTNNELNQTTRNMIINYVTPPSSLSLEISIIYDSLSKTNSFYNPIVNSLLKTGDSNPIDVQVNNFLARKELVVVNSMLYDTDPYFDDSLDNIAKYVLDDNIKNYWKNQDALIKVEKTYSEINRFYSNKEYSLVINKINYLKSQLKIVIQDGFVEEEINKFEFKTYYYYILAISIILIILLIFLKNKNFKKKSNFKKVRNTNINKKDPFS